jgi:hypothetical protein
MRQEGYATGFRLRPSSTLPVQKQGFVKSVFGSGGEGGGGGKGEVGREIAALGLEHLKLPRAPSNYVHHFADSESLPTQHGQEGGMRLCGSCVCVCMV